MLELCCYRSGLDRLGFGFSKKLPYRVWQRGMTCRGYGLVMLSFGTCAFKLTL